MSKRITISIIGIILLTSFVFYNKKTTQENQITKLEFHLSAYGVESDEFPTITGTIDCEKDSAYFVRSYYNPKYKTSSYWLTKKETEKVLQLLEKVNLDSLKGNTDVSRSDQPTAFLKIVCKEKTISIKDYGPQGTYPLKEIYNIVYKFEY